MTRWTWTCVLVACAALFGCKRAPESAEWIDDVRAVHEDVDRRSAEGDAEGAVRSLLDAARATPPGRPAPEDARVVRQDLFYRAATLELERGRAAEARGLAGEGLALGEAQDVFTANLLIARGQAAEAVGDSASAGRDYHRALVITDALLESALGDGKDPP